MKASIVLGLGFGDEGKGRFVSSLCSSSKNNPLVIRFNGGHQCGHTVLYRGRQHKFSTFGSGTLQEVPTFYSKYCTFFPEAFLKEYEDLKDLNPIFYIDPLCPVTTPFDVYHNIDIEHKQKHGSCGVGFGTTIERHENYYKLYIQDLFFDSVYKAKIENIFKYYFNKNPEFLTFDYKQEVLDSFYKQIEEVRKLIKVTTLDKLFYNFSELIFEGGQGILLDMDFGFFPNVTRSNTTAKNALEIIKELEIYDKHRTIDTEIFYISRVYQTRHGNGFMTNEQFEFPSLKNSHTETNQLDDWQGEFRKSILDIDLLNYALQCDNHFSYSLKKNLVLNCTDQIVNETDKTFPVTQNGKIVYVNFKLFAKILSIKFENYFINKNYEQNEYFILNSIEDLQKIWEFKENDITL